MAARTSYFTCNLCEAQCGLRVTADGDEVTGVRGNDEDLLSRGHICPKAHALLELFEDPDRLRAPRMRTPDGWRQASWGEALEEVGERLRAIRSRHGPDAVAFYYGNPTAHSHRSSLAVQLLTTALGTKNRYDPNSQDSAPRLFACMEMYGDALSMAVPDIERTDYLLVLGANPAVSNGSMWGLGDPKGRFEALRARGGKVVLLDPRRTESAAWATRHHFIRPDGDAAFLLAVLHVLFGEGLVDEASARAARRTHVLADLAAEFSPERVSGAVGMDAAVIRSIAHEFASAGRACAYSRVGVCQSAFGPVASWLVEALNVVTGNFDREGGVMFPTVAADVGPIARKLVGNHYGRWRSRVRGLPEFIGSLPSAAMAEEMDTPGDGQIRALVCMAGNPVLSTPNGPRLERALQKLDFFVALDFYINETTRHAHVVLPPKHVFETGNFDVLLSRFSARNVIKYSPPLARTEDDTRDDWSIAVDLALRLRAPSWLRAVASPVSRSRLPELLIDGLLRTGPYKTTLRALQRSPHGLDLGPLVRSGGERVRTPDRRINLAPESLVADVPRVAAWVGDRQTRDGLVLIGRRNLRSNNSWLHNVRSLAKGPDRARLLMNPSDAERVSVSDGDEVRVRSRAGEVTARVAITSDIMPGVVSLPHGFGHHAAADTLRVAGTVTGPNANALTDDQRVEPIIGTSILNGVPVALSKA